MLTSISFLSCSLEPPPIKLSPSLLKLLWSRAMCSTLLINWYFISPCFIVDHFFHLDILSSCGFQDTTFLHSSSFLSTLFLLLLSLLSFSSSSLRPLIVEYLRAQPFTFLFILLSCWSHLGHGFKCHLYMENSTCVSEAYSSLLNSTLIYPNG